MDFKYRLADFIDFRDQAELARVRAITREEITKHPNPNFVIKVIDDKASFYSAFAIDIVRRIRESHAADEKFVAIIPAGPIPQYKVAANMINHLRLPMRHVHFFAMDEYADEEGDTAPESWPGSFQKAIRENFIYQIDAKLRPPEDQVNFPVKSAINNYSDMIQDLGGADVCYGGIGWCGHIAFWESHLGQRYESLAEYKQARAQLVDLHPMTVMQNALHSFGGDWSFVPPKANTIGPADILGAKDRSFWLDGYFGGGISWQRFIARLVAHGPVNKAVPGSLLQEASTTYTLLGGVADDIKAHIA